MSTIVQNQKRAFVASAMDDARNLADSLRYLSEPQRAAILAVLAAASATPIDITLMGEPGDEVEAYSIVDGVLARASGPYAWKLGSGCLFTVDLEGGVRQ